MPRCVTSQRYGSSTRFFETALTARVEGPRVAGSSILQGGLRRLPSRFRSGSGCGALRRAQRAAWRKQAVTWLTASLAYWEKQLARDDPEALAWCKGCFAFGRERA
jgi:hypothetical protein